jgi:hypothetical protein
MTKAAKVVLGIVVACFVAYIVIWTAYNYANTPPEDFAQHGAGAVFAASLAGAFGGLLGLVLPVAILFAIGVVVQRWARKRDTPAVPVRTEKGDEHTS